METPANKINFIQPRNRYGATLTKLDAFYLFGGKSHEVHNDMMKLDVHLGQWVAISSSHEDFSGMSQQMSSKAQLPEPRFGHCALGYKSKVPFTSSSQFIESQNPFKNIYFWWGSKVQHVKT